MTDLYRVQRLFRDGETRLVIPNLKITAMDAIINIASSYVTNPAKRGGRFWTAKADSNSFDFNSTITGILARIIDIVSIGLGVTKIQTVQEYVMPFSKGIGSTGEVIHLLGAKNEMINLSFTTERYPGRMGYVLRAMLQYILEEAQVVYLIDDLFLATPCLIKKTKLSKEGLYRGAIMGELELVSLTTGGSFYTDHKGAAKKVSSTVKKYKNSILSAKENTEWIASRGTGTAIAFGVGAFAITSTLIAGIVGYGSG